MGTGSASTLQKVILFPTADLVSWRHGGERSWFLAAVLHALGQVRVMSSPQCVIQRGTAAQGSAWPSAMGRASKGLGFKHIILPQNCLLCHTDLLQP